MRSLVALLCLMGLALPGSAAASDDVAELESIRAHLVHAFSGTLSEELLARDYPFIGWNTPISEGDALEAADDVLVIVTLRSAGQLYLKGPLTISAQNEDGDEIGARSFSGMLTSEDGKGAFALYLPDSTCAGLLTIRAAFRGHEKTAHLQLNCGE